MKEIEKHAMGSEAKGPGFTDNNRIWTSDISKTKTTERYEINPNKTALQQYVHINNITMVPGYTVQYFRNESKCNVTRKCDWFDMDCVVKMEERRKRQVFCTTNTTVQDQRYRNLYKCKRRTYEGAKQTCRSMNARLCTVEEVLKLGKATGTGCSEGGRYKFDDEYLWTSHVMSEMRERNEVEYAKRKERVDIMNRTAMAQK